MFGLDDKTIEAIRRVLKEFPEIHEAKIFGSRALNTHRPNSDVDIVLYGPLDPQIAIQVRAKLEDLSTPYQFDIACYNHLQNPSLKDHIDRVGKKV